jgi:hypothetical protein
MTTTTFAMLLDETEARALRLVLHTGRLGLKEDQVAGILPADLKEFANYSVAFVEHVITNIDAVLGKVPWPDEAPDDEAPPKVQ